MKVLFFDPYYEGVYGNARYVTDLFNHEEVVGCTFYTCSPEVPAYLENLGKPERFFQLAYEQDSRLNKLGGALSRSSSIDKVRAIKNIATYTLRFKDLCRRESIDIVHCNSIRAILTVGIGAKLAGCKIVLYIKSNLVGYIYCIFSFILANVILFQTETNQSKSPKTLTTAFKSKFRILKNAIDMKRIDKLLDSGISSINQNLKKKENNLIYIGSIVERKGLRFLINALKKAKQNNLDFKLYLLGDEKMDKVHTLELKELIKLNRLENNIVFLGHKEEPLDFLKDMDCFILPSLDEGVPKSVIESICIGVPVIATNVGGTSEIINNSITGLIVEPGSEAELYVAINEFLENKIKFIESASAASPAARKEFSFLSHCNGLSSIYKSLNSK